MRKQRNLLTLVILLLVCVIGVGFAYLSSNLTINGTADVKASTWNVYFDNAKVSDGSVTTNSPTIGSDKLSTIFSTTLENPGDFYEFTMDIVNDGPIDAMIGDLDLDSLDTDEEKYLEYSVTYSDGVSINENDLLSADSTETIKVRIEFKKDINSIDLPSSGAKIEKEININYIQNDGGIAVNHTNMILTDNDGDGVASVSDLITIGTERFYVISNDGTNVKALAEWNLLVGNYCTSTSSCIPLTNPTGLQDSSSIGGHYYSGTHTEMYPYIGGVPFSSSDYWGFDDGVTIDLTNSLNTINPYLIAYKSVLNNLGGKINDISLITKDELISLGCDFSSNSCVGAPNWVYQTSYWTHTVRGIYFVWLVYYDGLFADIHYANPERYGVRPVITVLASDLK